MCIDGLIGQEEEANPLMSEDSYQMFAMFDLPFCWNCPQMDKDFNDLYKKNRYPSIDHYNLHVLAKHADVLMRLAYSPAEIESRKHALAAKLGM